MGEQLHCYPLPNQTFLYILSLMPKIKNQKMMQNLITQNKTLTPPQPGKVLEGEVLEIGKNRIFIDLGAFGIGVILGGEIKQSPQLIKDLKVGDKISVKVTDSENEAGFLELSFKEAQQEKTWTELEKAKKTKEVLKAKVMQANRGGLVIQIRNISGFLPVSQLSTKNYPRISDGDKNKILAHLNKFVNSEIEVQIIDLDTSEQKLIVSEKALNENKVAGLLANYKLGDVIEGEVAGVVDFGIFIRFTPPESSQILEGLVHISELDWQLIENPRDIVKVGQKVKAKIIGIDNGRLSLSIKALKKDPWENIEKEYKKGQIVKGKITKFNPFGAFVHLNKAIQGLIHISEFRSIEKMQQQLELDKEYKFKIISLEPKLHKMALSLAED